MAIDDLISMKVVAPPPAIDDLAVLRAPPVRLSILGKSRSIDRLREFPPVEAIWIGDVNQRQFDRILPLLDPVYLLFDGLRVADLTSLGKLQRLEALEIRWNTKVTDIRFLERLGRLRLLCLSHCPNVRDLGPIAALSNLEILDLSGGMWSTFRPDTLAPLSRLLNLRGLSLKSIRVGDGSLAPVAGLPNLQELELSNQFPTEEYARLSVALPHVRCRQFAPYLELGWGKNGDEVMITGARKPVLSREKDAARIERYVQQFRAMQDRFRSLEENC